jgi:hypothetical protein
MKISVLDRVAAVCHATLHQVGNRLRPWQVVALCLLVYVVMMLAWHSWDPMSFVIIGGAFDPSVSNGSLGYDGQFAYQIARNPLEGWRYVDVPAYRYQRILYPAVARLLSLGIPRLLPWVLILINLLALPAGTAVSETILVEHGTSRWYALTYGLYIGLLIPVRLNLTEPLAFLLVQVGVLTFSRDQRHISQVAFALAALTREVTLLFPIAYGLQILQERRWGEALRWTGLVAVPFMIWQIVLRLWFGEWGVGSGGALSTPFECVPFRGWWKMASVDVRAFAVMSLLVVPLALAPAVLSLIASVRDLASKHSSPTTWALLTNAAIFPFLPTSNVLEPLGLSRITAGLVVALLNFGAHNRNCRALNYSLLWISTVVFVYKDSFLPTS